MTDLQKAFAQKETKNGDIAFNTTGNNLLDILFMTEYYSNHLDEVSIGDSPVEQLFSMFVRDPRYGLGKRDLGRMLMNQSLLPNEFVVKCGRWDDLFHIKPIEQWADFAKDQILHNNQLCKKWMPRYSSKNLLTARKLAKYWGLNKQEYGKFIKCDTTTEYRLSHREDDIIDFEKVPSLAMIKYVKAFQRRMPERYNKYLEDVRKGRKKLNISTTNVYDIYRNRAKIDADLFFSKLERISGSWLPIVDTSGSMFDGNDSIGKAMSIGHYLGKTSTYCPNTICTFSNKPKLIELGKTLLPIRAVEYQFRLDYDTDSQYRREIASMYTGDFTNTDLKKVMDILQNLKTDFPEWLVILSDQEFDEGSTYAVDELMNYFSSIDAKTNILWWNFNSRNKTVCKTDDYGNCYLSGYNPFLLKFLQVGFDGRKFLTTLLEEYRKQLGL